MHTKRGNTPTGLWGLIDSVLSRLLSFQRRKEVQEAREREKIAARERIRREQRMGLR